jgi:peptidoglycan/xylan/chitin deacetylase (PgdA/CDA1 family)
VGPAASRAALAGFLCERFLELANTQREDALKALSTRLRVDTAGLSLHRSYATWEELRCAAAACCEIGGHTVDHLVLTCEDPATAQAQIIKSRTVIQQQTGQPVASFAYPNGRHDAAVRALTAAAGYRLAVTVQAGVNYSDTDPYELRRVPIHQERPFHLAFKLAFYGFVKRG